ncbi:MAG: hypothetical protein ACKV2Q_29390 [Planctomycetaceae bacterium]
MWLLGDFYRELHDMFNESQFDASHREGLVPSTEFQRDIAQEVPTLLDTLPDGRETLVIGDVDRCKDFNHPQGDNSLGFRGTCGLVSCEDVLRQFGVDVTEDMIVRYAAEHGLCHVGDDPAHCGGTTEFTQATLLKDFGVPAHVEFLGTLEHLADCLEHGRSVIVEVNAGVLWDDPNYVGSGGSNHAIVVTGVARDPQTGELQGFFVNDSGRGYAEDSGRFVDVSTMRQGWEETAGSGVVTDIVRTRPANV